MFAPMHFESNRLKLHLEEFIREHINFKHSLKLFGILTVSIDGGNDTFIKFDSNIPYDELQETCDCRSTLFTGNNLSTIGTDDTEMNFFHSQQQHQMFQQASDLPRHNQNRCSLNLPNVDKVFANLALEITKNLSLNGQNLLNGLEATNSYTQGTFSDGADVRPLSPINKMSPTQQASLSLNNQNTASTARTIYILPKANESVAHVFSRQLSSGSPNKTSTANAAAALTNNSGLPASSFNLVSNGNGGFSLVLNPQPLQSYQQQQSNDKIGISEMESGPVAHSTTYSIPTTVEMTSIGSHGTMLDIASQQVVGDSMPMDYQSILPTIHQHHQLHYSNNSSELEDDGMDEDQCASSSLDPSRANIGISGGGGGGGGGSSSMDDVCVENLSVINAESGIVLNSCGRKFYNCRFCSKVFNRKFCRERHERLHTGIKPYTCDHCDERFIRLEDRKRHEKVCTRQKCNPGIMSGDSLCENVIAGSLGY